MRRTTRIPVYRQPPVWLVACVVVAAVLPLLLRAFGIEVGPAIEVSRTASARAIASDDHLALAPVAASAIAGTTALSPVARSAVASTSAAALSPVARSASASAITPGPTVTIEGEDDEAEDIVVILDEPDASRDATAVSRDNARRDAPQVDAPVAEPRSVVAEAKLACRRGNKDTARSIVRDLPIGDPRRKQIRKACRGEGVWVL